MYTELKSYQIIIALLKEYGINQCVLSAGSRNLPFVHSVEKDPYFECYSVVDERSAGYFALGLAQQSGRRRATIGQRLQKRFIKTYLLSCSLAIATRRV